MLRREWLPTPLIPHRERRPVELRPHGKPPRFPAWRTISKLGGYFLTNLRKKFAGTRTEQDDAIRLRTAFEEIGGLWIKIGQLLSLRTDIFSEVMCRELARLQHRAVGFPPAEAMEILERELGRPIDEVFSEFQEHPLAAASISQVHIARLRAEDVVVAVKIRRPEARPSFERDLNHIGAFIRVLQIFGIGSHLHLRDGFRALRQMVEEELDFRYEAANTRRMRKTLREHKIYVPKVFVAYSSRLVFVSEFVAGVLMSDYIQVLNDEPHRAEFWCVENHIDPKKVGKRLFHTIVRQLLDDNLFHADLHPGNIVLLRDSRFALIDFGAIGTNERSFLANYKISLRAMGEKDFHKAADMQLRFAIDPPALSRLKDLRDELVMSYQQWETQSHLSGVGYHERSLGAAGAASGRIMYKYQVHLTWEFMRIGRSWSTLDASLSYLIPDANYIKLFAEYFRKKLQRTTRPLALLSAAARAVHNTAASISEYKEILEPALRKQYLVSAAFGSASERLLSTVSVVFQFVKMTLFAALIVSFVVFLNIDSNGIGDGKFAWLDHTSAMFSHLPAVWRWLIFCFIGLALVMLRKASRKLDRGL